MMDGSGVNTDGKGRWDVDTDVLLRKCVFQVDVDGEGLQGQAWHNFGSAAIQFDHHRGNILRLRLSL